jgi:hypothetical protein
VTQTIVVVLLVLVAAVYLGRAAWRALRPKTEPGCGSGCGCDSAGSSLHPRRR